MRTCQVLLIVVVLGLWEVASRRGWVSESRYSSPSAVWDELVVLYRNDVLVTDGAATLKAMSMALLIGVPSGVAAGLILAAAPFLDRVVGPFLIPLNSIPRIALAPLFIVWFGLTMSAKVALALSIIFFIIVFNARAAVKNVDPDLVVVARLLDMPLLTMYRKVILPASIPTVFAGVRLAVTYSLLGVIASEMIAARDGLGVSIVRYGALFQVSGIFAVLLVLCMVAIVFGTALDIIERWLLRWQ